MRDTLANITLDTQMKSRYDRGMAACDAECAGLKSLRTLDPYDLTADGDSVE
jgi:hypothetical protein